MTYEVRITIAQHRLPEWLDWIHPHMQAVLQTGCFTRAGIEQVIDPEQPTPTFIVRYEFHEMDDYARYVSTYAEALREESRHHFGDTMTTSRQLLQPVQP